jgi:hypothetical protein
MAASSAVGTSSVRIFLFTFRRPSRIRYGGAENLIERYCVVGAVTNVCK